MSITPDTTGIDAETMERSSLIEEANAKTIKSILSTFNVQGLGSPSLGVMLHRIAELEHYQRHFASLAKVNPSADHALSTARREWEAKKGRG